MAAHEYFTKQTSHLLSGHLVVVKQGLGGAISLVIVRLPLTCPLPLMWAHHCRGDGVFWFAFYVSGW